MTSQHRKNDVRARLLDALALFTEEEEEKNRNQDRSHAMNELHELYGSNSKATPTINKPCMHYLWQGTCHTPNCKYLHTKNFRSPSPNSSPTQQDIHSNRGNFKSGVSRNFQECQFFNKHGVCGYGDKCKYIHIRNPEAHTSNHVDPCRPSSFGGPNPHRPNKNRWANETSPAHRSPFPRRTYPQTRASMSSSMYEENYEGSSPDRSPKRGSNSHGRSYAGDPIQNGSYKRTSPLNNPREFRGSDSGFGQNRTSPPHTISHRPLLSSPCSSTNSPSSFSSASPPKVVSIPEVQKILENTSEQVLKVVNHSNLSNIDALFVCEKHTGCIKRLFQGPTNAEKYRHHVMSALRALDQKTNSAILFFKDARQLAILQQLMKASFSTLAGHHPELHQDLPIHSFQRCFLPLLFLGIHPTLCLPIMLDTAEMLHAFFLVSLRHLFDQFHQCTQKCLTKGLLEEPQCSSRTLLMYDSGFFIPFSFLQVFAPFIQLLDILVTKYPDLMQLLFEGTMVNSLETLLNTWCLKVETKALPTMESKLSVTTVKLQFEKFKSKLTGLPQLSYRMNRRELM